MDKGLLKELADQFLACEAGKLRLDKIVQDPLNPFCMSIYYTVTKKGNVKVKVKKVKLVKSKER